MNWYVAKRWHDILSSIPMAKEQIEEGVPSVEVSKHSPNLDQRTEALEREAEADRLAEVADENVIKSAKISGEVISLGDHKTGYGTVKQISKNQFGDYIFTFELNDGTSYELSEFHLRK
jgi:hypothetical protein